MANTYHSALGDIALGFFQLGEDATAAGVPEDITVDKWFQAPPAFPAVIAPPVSVVSF